MQTGRVQQTVISFLPIATGSSLWPSHTHAMQAHPAGTLDSAHKVQESFHSSGPRFSSSAQWECWECLPLRKG